MDGEFICPLSRLRGKSIRTKVLHTKAMITVLSVRDIPTLAIQKVTAVIESFGGTRNKLGI